MRAMAATMMTGMALCWLTAAGLAGGEEVDPQRVSSAQANGLQWLVEHQITEGPEAGRWPGPNNNYSVATASFGGLALLANGYRPSANGYGRCTDLALGYVMRSMDPDGYLGQGDKSGMYIHAAATLLGLAALGTLDDPERERELAEWCRKAVRVIVEAQEIRRPSHSRGGWRYTPFTTESDLSVSSWQILTLHAARSCGYPVADAVFDRAIGYVDRAYLSAEFMRDEEGEIGTYSRDAAGEWQPDPAGEQVVTRPAGYTYRAGMTHHPEASVTGAAIFVKSVVEGRIDSSSLSVLPLLRAHPPSWGGEHYDGFFFFAAFYTTQGMFQLGGDDWERYHRRLQRVVVDHQAGDGSWPFPEDNASQSRLAGDAYSTAMSLLLLSQQQQFLPMYQRQVALF